MYDFTEALVYVPWSQGTIRYSFLLLLHLGTGASVIKERVIQTADIIEN